MPTQNILGIYYGTTLDTLADKNQAYGNQLSVFLTSQSQVGIFRDGRLLATKVYPAGYQVLDTSSLPTGAYEVSIQIRNNQKSIKLFQQMKARMKCIEKHLKMKNKEESEKKD